MKSLLTRNNELSAIFSFRQLFRKPSLTAVLNPDIASCISATVNWNGIFDVKMDEGRKIDPMLNCDATKTWKLG